MMKIENRVITFARFLVMLLVCSIIIGGGFLNSNKSEQGGILAKAGDMLPFVKPAFAQSLDVMFLEEEAGISIYTNIEHPLDLSKARAALKTEPEKETSSYVIGSVSLPNLPETEDVHCYVQKDGWIVVYYFKDEPTSKVIDWNYYSAGKLTKTKLQIGMEKVCNALEVATTDTEYYHFQYTYATKWMIVVDNDNFRMKIPSEFTIYERSWASSMSVPTSGGQLALKVNDKLIYLSLQYTGPKYANKPYGVLTPNELFLDEFNYITNIGERAAIVLLYKES